MEPWPPWPYAGIGHTYNLSTGLNVIDRVNQPTTGCERNRFAIEVRSLVCIVDEAAQRVDRRQAVVEALQTRRHTLGSSSVVLRSITTRPAISR